MMEREINVNELNTLLGTDKIKGVWISGEYYQIGYGRSMCLVVEQSDV